MAIRNDTLSLLRIWSWLLDSHRHLHLGYICFPKKIFCFLNKRFKSITRWLFITGQFFALIWVSTSYILAAYATFILEQPFPIETLSEQAIVVLLGTLSAKVIENIFEHNNGGIFGKNDSANDSENVE